MTRRTEPPTPPTPPAGSRVVTPGSRGIAALVVSAIEEGRLARLPNDRAIDSCVVIEAAVPALTLGDLGVDDSAWAERHMETCPECRSLLGQTRRLDALIGQGSAQLIDIQAVQAPVRRDQAKTQTARSATVWSMETPVGDVFVAVSDRGVCEVDFAATIDEPSILARLRTRGFVPEMIAADRRNAEAETISEQVSDYLSGKRRSLDLPYDLGPVTPFTRQVLEATATIPFGSISTYGAIAARIGQPTASRAIGNALGRNPVPLLIPCHRVVRSDFTPGGFVGGSGIKEQLLTLEGAMLNRPFSPAR